MTLFYVERLSSQNVSFSIFPTISIDRFSMFLDYQLIIAFKLAHKLFRGLINFFSYRCTTPNADDSILQRVNIQLVTKSAITIFKTSL